jgi:Uma2 family endonuclease
LKVLVAPLDVGYTENTVLQPDVLVASRTDLGERNLEGVPRLAAEVLSPSTRHLDLAFKRSRYEAAGCPSYWVIDPSVPSIVCWELTDGTYLEVARADGNERADMTQPFPVTISPADLID